MIKEIKKIFKKLFLSNKKNYISKPTELLKVKNNVFIGNLPKMTNSKIIFNGKNNILFCDENVCLEDSILNFECNNSVIYLSS